MSCEQHVWKYRRTIHSNPVAYRMYFCTKCDRSTAEAYDPKTHEVIKGSRLAHLLNTHFKGKTQ